MIQKNQPLKHFNTFGLDATAAYYAPVTSHSELLEALAFAQAQNLPIQVLGGGSNVLFQSAFLNVVLIHILFKKIEITAQTHQKVWLNVGAGENWHEFVCHCIAQNWANTENLALIPGTVGAAPIQNIGAYGMELKDICHQVTGYNLDTKRLETIAAAACAFGYRSSIFKTDLKNKFIITQVGFELQKPPHQPQTQYAGIAEYLHAQGIAQPSIAQVAAAVVAVRQAKLPNPAVVGNAGSFFKNPVVAQVVFDALKASYPSISGYKNGENDMKLSAAWLIDQCGYKGKRSGETGTYRNHALVLVNYGQATGAQIWDFAQEIRTAVTQKFGIDLEPEVNLVR